MKALKFEIVPLAEVIGKLNENAEKTGDGPAENPTSERTETANSHRTTRPGKSSEDAHTMRVRAGSEAKREYSEG